MKRRIAIVCKDMQGQVPTEIQVIPGGFHQTPKGDFLCDALSFQMVIEAYNARINDMVIDYEHQTLSGMEAPAAGWIKELIDKGQDGIWARVEWTERAAQYIASKEYRYVSPVFFVRDADKRVTELYNVALTNQPNIDGMVPLINKSAEAQKIGSAEGIQTKEEKTMKGLLSALGLPETATEQEAIAVVNKLQQSLQIVANKAVLDALGLKEGATESEVTGTIMAMKQSHGQAGNLAEQVRTLSSKIAERDANDAVTLAINDGKITPAQKDWALDYAKRDIEGFKVFVSKAPKVIITDKVADEGGQKAEGSLDETVMMVSKMFGNTAEDIKKYGTN
jgi:phage I-like protein